jgi:hypothetical protein
MHIYDYLVLLCKMGMTQRSWCAILVLSTCIVISDTHDDQCRFFLKYLS